jgi:2-haloacid dehalogenase
VSNGSALVAQTLLEGAGVRHLFERLLSVEEAGIWKPASGAYDYALAECGVDAEHAMLVAMHHPHWTSTGRRAPGLARHGSTGRAVGTRRTFRAGPCVASLPELVREIT